MWPPLLALVSIALAWILAPFYGTLLWAVIIAMLFAPMYRRLLARSGGLGRNGAALATLAAVIAIVMVPFALVSGALAAEAVRLVDQVKTGELDAGAVARRIFDALPPMVVDLLARAGLPDLDALQSRLATFAAQGSQWLAARALSIGQDTFAFVADFFITTYVAFFLIRDGDDLALAVRRALPMAPGSKSELFERFGVAVRATVKGNLVVAAVQGALGGLAFWVLDIRAPILWAVLMAFASLLPAIGAALVWGPVAAWLLLTGEWVPGLSLIAWGVLAIGLVDNFLRPVLVGKDARMPDWLVLVTTLGGMAIFGLNGFVIGPVIAALFLTSWQIATAARREQDHG